MEIKQIKSVIESILFAYAEPIKIEDIHSVLNDKVSKKEIQLAMNELIEEYDNLDKGIRIYKLENKYQMGTDKSNSDYIKAILNPNKKKSLSNAAIETLTIIAYRQPITKVELESIRGVKCDTAIERLIDLGLIIDAGRLDKIGKPILYKITEEALKLFEISSVEDLPPIEMFDNKEFNEKVDIMSN